MKNILTKLCLVCGKEFAKPINESVKNWLNRHKYCSKSCLAKFTYSQKLKAHQFTKERHYIPPTAFKKGERPSKKTEFQKGHKPFNKGISGNEYLPEESRKRMATWKDKFEDKSPHWKGDNVGYSGVHIWIKQWYGNPPSCEHCGKQGKKVFAGGNRYRWTIEWANVSGRYLRDRNDFIGLCKSCHMKFDSK